MIILVNDKEAPVMKARVNVKQNEKRKTKSAALHSPGNTDH
jgi:hypothetical protein